MSGSTLRNTRIRDLSYLVSVYEHASIRAAARAHNISQPHLSKIIHDIESDIGVPIFKREGNRTVPTDVGKLLIENSKQSLASIEAIERKVLRIRRKERSYFHVGGVPNPTTRLITCALLKVVEVHPEIQVEISLGLSENLIDGLKHRVYDLVIARAVSDEVASPLVYELLYPERGVVLARSGHPLAGGAPASAARLGNFSWILPRIGPTRAAIEFALINAGLRVPQPLLVNHDLPIVAGFIASTDALTVISARAVEPLIRSGEFCAIDVGIDFNLPSYALYRWPDQSVELACAALRHAIVREAKTVLDGGD